ncbi:MAG: acyltransferase family protein [Pseudomonadota bacterium]
MQQISFRPDLQGLRAVAVLLVVFAHAEIPPFGGGFVGVDVFFVLSGYLISALLLNEIRNTGRIQLSLFYSRRLRRLFPALLLVIVITALAASLLLPDKEAIGMLSSTPYAAIWSSNLFFAFRDYDYFDETANRDLFLHTWSLGVEEQFYIIWPLILLLLILPPSLRHGKPSYRLAQPLSLILFFLFIGSLYVSSLSSTLAFYLMPARMYEFALGALVFVTQTTNSQSNTPREEHNAIQKSLAALGIKQTNTQLQNIPLWIGMGLLLTSATLASEDLSHPPLWALAPAIGTALIIRAGSTETQRSFLCAPSMIWIGNRSYSIYLWHWPVLKLSAALGFTTHSAKIALMLAITLILADFSYRYVERPLWKAQLQNTRPHQVILLSVLMMGFVYTLWMNIEPYISPPAIQRTLSKYEKTRLDHPVIYDMGCDTSIRSSDLTPCMFNQKNYEKTVVLLGDSIGAQWFSAVRERFSEPQWRLVVHTKSACAILDETYVYRPAGGKYYACFEWREKALRDIEAMQPEVVVLGSAASYGFFDEQWREGSSRFFSRLSKSSKWVYVIVGTPWLSFDGPSCIERTLENDELLPEHACRQENTDPTPLNVAQNLRDAAARFPNIHVIDPAPLVCPEGICRAMTSTGIGVYRDTQHLTDSFVRSLAPDLGRMMLTDLSQ